MVIKGNSPGFGACKGRLDIVNRKEGNDQESIQLPNTFRFKTPTGKKDALKVTALQSKHYKQKAKRTVSSNKWPKGYLK